MKRLLIGLSLLAAACSSQMPVNPSGAKTDTQASVSSQTPAAGPAADGPTVDPTPPVPGANAATPQYTLTKPAAAPKPDNPSCYVVSSDAMEWVLNVTDAGPSHLRFVAMAFQDEQPGCAPTTKNGRGRLDMSGVTDYTPHSSGQTRFKFNPKTDVPVDFCGRVQLDVSIFDATGKEILIVGVVVDY